MAPARTTDNSPTISDTRAPARSRERMSRPRLSVPSGWAESYPSSGIGGRRARVELISAGGWGISHGASRAARAGTPTQMIPIQPPMGIRRSRAFQERERRPRDGFGAGASSLTEVSDVDSAKADPPVDHFEEHIG